MDFLDSLIQILVSAFVGAIILWALSSFAELRICRYLYEALKITNRLIASERTFDLKILPEIVVTEGAYHGRKAVVRLNVLSEQFFRYRIHVHLLVQAGLSSVTRNQDPLLARHPARTIVWKCSFLNPPPYGDIHIVLKELTGEAEAVEMERS